MKKLWYLLIIILFMANSEVKAQFGEAITEFELLCPPSFNHDTQIDVSLKKAKISRTVDRVEPCLTSANFAKASAKLIPSGSYLVKIIPITETVTSQQCLEYLKKQNAIPVGLHGLTLVFELKKDKLPKDRWIVSFAPKEELYVDKDGNHVVPYVHTFQEGEHSFEAESFENEYCWIPPNRTLLCIIKK